jgi:hypothetical protein
MERGKYTYKTIMEVEQLLQKITRESIKYKAFGIWGDADRGIALIRNIPFEIELDELTTQQD